MLMKSEEGPLQRRKVKVVISFAEQVTNSSTVSLVFLVLGILLGRSLKAANNVGGVIPRNTVRTSDESANPFTLTIDVQILIGVTLTVQAGVQVIFDDGHFKILVRGASQTEGKAQSPFYFQVRNEVIPNA